MRPVLPATVLRRAVLRTRQSPFTSTRFASSNTNSSVEATQKKAQEALASAQQNAGRVLEGTKKFLEPAGQKFGQLLGSYKQPLQYNFAVTREVIKQIYVAEGLQPPTLAAVREAYATIWTRAISPAYWRGIAQNGELLKVGIYGVEAYTIFKVGEIIGRLSLVGYNLH